MRYKIQMASEEYKFTSIILLKDKDLFFFLFYRTQFYALKQMITNKCIIIHRESHQSKGNMHGSLSLKTLTCLKSQPVSVIPIINLKRQQES